MEGVYVNVDGQRVLMHRDRLVQVQITIPAQPGNPASFPRAFAVQVPAHTLQPGGPTSQLLQQVVAPATPQAQTLQDYYAAVLLQNQINSTFRLNY